jgi:hypothetical protein
MHSHMSIKIDSDNFMWIITFHILQHPLKRCMAVHTSQLYACKLFFAYWFCTIFIELSDDGITSQMYHDFRNTIRSSIRHFSNNKIITTHTAFSLIVLICIHWMLVWITWGSILQSFQEDSKYAMGTVFPIYNS